MPFRSTKGIVTKDGDPAQEADVIMTAAALGLAGSYIATTKSPIQFDMDPLDVPDQTKANLFKTTVDKMDEAVGAYLKQKRIAPGKVKAGTSPGYSEGAIVMGVYTLAGKSAPQSVSAPVLSEKGKALWEKISKTDIKQYTGRGAYTGFVDNKNTIGDTDPVGPRSTARFLAPAPGLLDPDLTRAGCRRWTAPFGRSASAKWKARTSRGVRSGAKRRARIPLAPAPGRRTRRIM